MAARRRRRSLHDQTTPRPPVLRIDNTFQRCFTCAHNMGNTRTTAANALHSDPMHCPLCLFTATVNNNPVHQPQDHHTFNGCSLALAEFAAANRAIDEASVRLNFQSEIAGDVPHPTEYGHAVDFRDLGDIPPTTPTQHIDQAIENARQREERLRLRREMVEADIARENAQRRPRNPLPSGVQHRRRLP